ncbi:LysM domain-containing protein [Burkholderiales bacterium JOSHI_001]|nr:LysM domain-containing protein [Burkholderiales bacterium JOSHI_001]
MSAPQFNAIARRSLMAAAAGALLMGAGGAVAVNYPVTPGQRGTAEQVAQQGVPLSELSPNAPESHTVQRGDTLWDISKLFLKSPWRWPELWGMNMQQIRNPHLIYPGQVLVLVKEGGRARLVMGQPGAGAGGTVKLSPRSRANLLDNGAIASIPLHLISPFLNEAVVFNTNELERSPRVVATQEGRVLVSRGETAYVRGDLQGAREFRLFREPLPLRDPSTKQILGYEAKFVGTASQTREGAPAADSKQALVPSSIMVTSIRQEVGVGDRLAPVPAHDYSAYVPHPPSAPISGQLISIYGEALTAGQNQIVAINRGTKDGVERGHVLALWRAGTNSVDRTSEDRQLLKLPDERVGLLFVFRVFDQVSYALILQSVDPVSPGDRFTQP